MAEIDIERRRGMGWLWLLMGVAVVALVAWLLLANDGDRMATDTVGTYEPTTEVFPTPTAMPGDASRMAHPEVDAYLSECAPEVPAQMDLSHDHTANCARQLVNSIQALTRQTVAGPDLESELQSIHQSVDRFAASEQTSDHSRMVREIFDSINGVFENLASDRSVLQGQLGQLRQAAESVTPTQPLLNQRVAVQNYFNRAGAAVSEMAPGSTAATAPTTP